MVAYLVVDDSPTIRLSLVAALRAAHAGGPVEVTEASTEREAVERFLGGSYDVVFLDMMLGGARSALDVLRAILAARPEAKVVLVTGLDREHPDVVEAVSLGAFSYVRKPVRVAEIREAIEEIAAERGERVRIR